MFIKKVVGVTVYISIITLFVFGCMNIKSSVGNKNIEKYFHENVDERYRIGVENYVFLIKNHQMELGCDDLTSDPMCMPLTTSTATGQFNGFTFDFDPATVGDDIAVVDAAVLPAVSVPGTLLEATNFVDGNGATIKFTADNAGVPTLPFTFTPYNSVGPVVN